MNATENDHEGPKDFIDQVIIVLDLGVEPNGIKIDLLKGREILLRAFACCFKNLMHVTQGPKKIPGISVKCNHMLDDLSEKRSRIGETRNLKNNKICDESRAHYLFNPLNR